MANPFLASLSSPFDLFLSSSALFAHYASVSPYEAGGEEDKRTLERMTDDFSFSVSTVSSPSLSDDEALSLGDIDSSHLLLPALHRKVDLAQEMGEEWEKNCETTCTHFLRAKSDYSSSRELSLCEKARRVEEVRGRGERGKENNKVSLDGLDGPFEPDTTSPWDVQRMCEECEEEEWSSEEGGGAGEGNYWVEAPFGSSMLHEKSRDEMEVDGSNDEDSAYEDSEEEEEEEEDVMAFSSHSIPSIHSIHSDLGLDLNSTDEDSNFDKPDTSHHSLCDDSSDFGLESHLDFGFDSPLNSHLNSHLDSHLDSHLNSHLDSHLDSHLNSHLDLDSYSSSSSSSDSDSDYSERSTDSIGEERIGDLHSIGYHQSIQATSHHHSHHHIPIQSIQTTSHHHIPIQSIQNTSHHHIPIQSIQTTSNHHIPPQPIQTIDTNHLPITLDDKSHLPLLQPPSSDEKDDWWFAPHGAAIILTKEYGGEKEDQIEEVKGEDMHTTRRQARQERLRHALLPSSLSSLYHHYFHLRCHLLSPRPRASRLLSKTSHVSLTPKDSHPLQRETKSSLKK